MKKKILIVSALLFSAIVMYLLLQFFFLGKATLEIKSSEKNISFILNGQVLTAPTVVKNLEPGEYTITSHISGFKPFETKIKLKRMRKDTVELKFENYTTVEETIDDGSKEILIGDRGQKEATEAALKKQEEAHPLIKHLPYFADSFWLDYSVEGDQVTYFLQSSNFEGDLKKAQVWIDSLGIDHKTIYINKK